MALFKDGQEIIEEFVIDSNNKKSDYLKRENSNFIYSLSLLRKNLSNKEEEQFLMEEVFSKELVKSYDEGFTYIHDKQLSSYCQSISCKDVAERGLPTLAKNMIASEPTKRLKKLFRHFSNLVVLMSQQVSGAVMLAQMTTVLASYLHYEETQRGNLWSEDDLEDEMQSFIWELNLPLRSGSESSFTNCTLEFGKSSEEIKDEFVIIGGNLMDYQYKEIPSIYFDRINKAFIDTMAKGTGKKGIPFTFPLISIQIDDDFDFSNKMFLYLLDKMYYWGGAYFENFRSAPFNDEYYKSINPYIKPRDPSVSRSLCCRLTISLDALQGLSSGGIFGSSVGNVGAIQVIDIDLNRLLFEYGHNKELLFEKIDYYLELIEEGHMAKRRWVENNKELYPTFFAFNDNLKNYFNVFGIVGTHEGLINIGYKNGLNDPEGKAFAHEIMRFIRQKVDGFTIRDQVACGVEASPAENAAIKLARHAQKAAKVSNREIFLQGEGEDVYLSSGCMVPFSESDFLLQIENSAEFQPYYTSGSILHHFIEEKIEPEKLAKHIDEMFKKPVTYVTLTPTTGACMECGKRFIGQDAAEVEICPNCGSDDLATYSRVIGYVKMISRKGLKKDKDKKIYQGKYNFWSKARRSDWAERKRLKIEDLLNDIPKSDN